MHCPTCRGSGKTTIMLEGWGYERTCPTCNGAKTVDALPTSTIPHAGVHLIQRKPDMRRVMWFDKDTPLLEGMYHSTVFGEPAVWWKSKDGRSDFSIPYDGWIMLREDGTFGGFLHDLRDYEYVGPVEG